MAELGNILEGPGQGPSGPDLKFHVKVPHTALGRGTGYAVKVPLQLPADGGLVSRAVSGMDDGQDVQLHLPKELPAGAVLRLRGQGGVRDGARPGDLYVHIEVVPARPVWPWAVAALMLAGAVAAAVGMF